MVVCLFCLFCCNTLSDFGLIFLNWSSYRAEKYVCKEKIVRRLAWELLNPILQIYWIYKDAVDLYNNNFQMEGPFKTSFFFHVQFKECFNPELQFRIQSYNLHNSTYFILFRFQTQENFEISLRWKSLAIKKSTTVQTMSMLTQLNYGVKP